jgi:hypothetical protein
MSLEADTYTRRVFRIFQRSLLPGFESMISAWVEAYEPFVSLYFRTL